MPDGQSLPDAQTIHTVLNAYGVSNLAGSGGDANWGYWIANILFGIIGGSAFMFGWKEKSVRPTIIGVAMMIFPYFITNAYLAFAIGFGLLAALYYWRE